ncbi:alcohol dehydrogenase catalytic domain-containing protein [Kineococcus xinjiangensis]|uniref:alcohol dehydrogenase catalytic domain-containing protein n=1 Tax=Kineococcus xinjiangensis TaxID=512762 RepID=UPI003CCC29B6
MRRGDTCALQHVPTPTPGPGEVVIAAEMVSLCGTDIQILRGMRDDPSPIVGHEGLARVAAVGEGVENLAIGQRVMVNPTAPDDPSFLLGHNVEGLFQERTLLPASAVTAGQIVSVGAHRDPKTTTGNGTDTVSSTEADLDAGLGTLVEPLAVVRYALACLTRQQVTHLVVLGGGLIGLLAALVARRTFGPAMSITVVHHNDDVRAWAQRALGPGLHHVDDRDADTHLQHAVDAPCAVLAAGYRDATVTSIDTAATLLRDRLRAVHAVGGVAAGDRSAVFPSLDLAAARAANTGAPWPPRVSEEIPKGAATPVHFTGNRGVSNDMLQAAFDELRRHGADYARLLTHRVGMAEGVALINTICRDKQRVVNGSPVIRLVVDLHR